MLYKTEKAAVVRVSIASPTHCCMLLLCSSFYSTMKIIWFCSWMQQKSRFWWRVKKEKVAVPRQRSLQAQCFLDTWRQAAALFPGYFQSTWSSLMWKRRWCVWFVDSQLKAWLSVSGWTYWCARLHTCSREHRYLLSPNSSEYIGDRAGRNNYFQKKNWAKPKGECWSTVGRISYRVRKKMILKAYKIPGAVISAAGSIYMFWSDSLPLSELDLTKENKLLFYSRSIPPQYQHLPREMVLAWLLSLRVVQLVHRVYWGAAWGHPTWDFSITPAKRGFRWSWLPEPSRIARARGWRVLRINVSFSHANRGKKLLALYSKSFLLLQHHWLLPCHCVPSLQHRGKEAGRGDFLTLLEPF